jgi:hypothetical protein
MNIRRRSRVAAAALSTVALTIGGLAGAADAAASAPAKVPTVVVHMTSKSVTLSTGSKLHAGRVLFKVVSAKGEHDLQIARLHSGYTLQQAGADLNQAFGGDVAAVRRVDKNITFRGGAEAEPKSPGHFATVLKKGRYVFLDQDTNSYTWVNVVGSAPARAAVPTDGSITTYTYGFANSPDKLPASGAATIANRSDQPHFVVLQQVKSNTTRKMVRKYFQGSSEGQPSFALKASTSSGVLSPKKSEVFQYNLPAGKYVVACFWPDKDTGMPHAAMGMWKLLWLK